MQSRQKTVQDVRAAPQAPLAWQHRLPVHLFHIATPPAPQCCLSASGLGHGAELLPCVPEEGLCRFHGKTKEGNYQCFPLWDLEEELKDLR